MRTYKKDKNASMLRVRMSENDDRKLESISGKLNISKSEVVRYLIDTSWGALCYEESKKCI